MAVTWKVDNTRTSVYNFDPRNIVAKDYLNGRHDAPNIEALIASIVRDGQLQPMLVRNEGDKPVLVAGFSRWTAISEINKRKLTPERMKIACTYVRCNEQDGFIRNWQENRVRNSTTPMDDAHHFAQMERWGLDAKAIAEKLEVTPKFVKQRLALIETTPEVQAAVASGRLKAPAAARVAKLTVEHQNELVAGNGNVASTAVDKALGRAPKITVKMVRAAIVDELELDVEDQCAEVLRRLLEMIDGKEV